jgi:hypothetical protein
VRVDLSKAVKQPGEGGLMNTLRGILR